MPGSACTSVENLSHKVTRKTTVLLREVVNRLYQSLARTDAEICKEGSNHLMPANIWEQIQVSILEARNSTFRLFWTKGSTWSDIDTSIAVEIRKGASTWSRDRSERAKKAFLTLGAVGVQAATDKSTLQYMSFECEDEPGTEIMSTCTGVKEYKQGGSMVTGGFLPLDRLHLTFLPSPDIFVAWRSQINVELQYKTEPPSLRRSSEIFTSPRLPRSPS